MNISQYFSIFTLLFFSFLGSAITFKTTEKNNRLLFIYEQQRFKDSLLCFDQSHLLPFFEKYPEFDYLKSNLTQLYQNNNYKYRWFDQHGISEYGHLLYDKVINIQSEGVAESPYKSKLDAIFQNANSLETINPENELFLSATYINYMEKVYCGLDIEKSTSMGWYIPRKNLCVLTRLDSILQKTNLLFEQDNNRIAQYNKLKKFLEQYRTIEKNGDWQSIDVPKLFTNLKPNDTSEIVIKLK